MLEGPDPAKALEVQNIISSLVRACVTLMQHSYAVLKSSVTNVVIREGEKKTSFKEDRNGH